MTFNYAFDENDLIRLQESNTCENCDLSCLTCSGNLSNECLSCDNPNYLISNECKPTCPIG